MFLRIRDILQIMALASIFLCGSCSGEGKGRSGDGNAAGSSVAELPLPDVPAELTEPKERCAYVLEHFWDRMDFRDRRFSVMPIPWPSTGVSGFFSTGEASIPAPMT